MAREIILTCVDVATSVEGTRTRVLMSGEDDEGRDSTIVPIFEMTISHYNIRAISIKISQADFNRRLTEPKVIKATTKSTQKLQSRRRSREELCISIGITWIPT